MTDKRRRGPVSDRAVHIESVFRDPRRFLSRFVWSVVLAPPLAKRGLNRGGSRAAGK